MLTLEEIQDSPRIAAVASACPTSAEFLSLVNTACRRYMRRGDFIGTNEDLFVCVTQGCLVTPRYVHKIRRIKVCSREIEVHNGWWRFMDSSQGNREWENWRGQNLGLQDRGTTSVFQDVMGDGRTIRAYPQAQGDIGKTMQFFGTDNNGQPLQTRNPDGTWDMGITLTLQSPFGEATNGIGTTYVRHIDYVLREKTQKPVDCYAYNVATGLLEELAHYQPSETKPQYARYQLNLHWPTCGTAQVQPNCCSTKRGVILRVKLKMIDAADPTDVLPIDNIDALEFMMQAVKAGNAGDFAEKTKWEAAAVKEGNLELADDTPDEQFPASNNVLGPSVWSNQVF